MKLCWDEAKRKWTREERGLDFADAAAIFAGERLAFPDIRFDYGEERWITVGLLVGRMMVVVWTPRAGGRHVISMRKANEREQKKFGQRLGQIGRP